MKSLIIILMLGVQILYMKLNAQSIIDTTFEILKRIDYASYVRKPIDSLLYHLPVNYLTMKISGHHKPNYGDELHIFYPNDVMLIIRVKTFQYMNPKPDFVNNPNANWDINLFKKEDLFFAALYRGPICYVGCDKSEEYAH